MSDLDSFPTAPHSGPTCPECGSKRVLTTLHGVFARAGNTIFERQYMTSLETICDDCDHTFHDERAEELIRTKYPEFF